MRQRAYAKINFCLDVAGVREDGYHELRMIMAPIQFYDVLEITPTDGEVEMISNKTYIPINEKNTVIKAYWLLKERYGFTQEYKFKLEKHIPTQAGLGGGSADAAAAIRMLNKLEQLNMSREEMIEIALKVGSDVPFCVFNTPALVEGKGDILTPFECKAHFHILLVKPRKGVSTKAAFSLLDEMEYPHPDPIAMKEALEQDDYRKVLDNLGNSLEAPALQLVPEIGKIKAHLNRFGFDGVLMSGSGSTVFGITGSKYLLDHAMMELKNMGYFARATQLLDIPYGWK